MNTLPVVTYSAKGLVWLAGLPVHNTRVIPVVEQQLSQCVDHDIVEANVAMHDPGLVGLVKY